MAENDLSEQIKLSKENNQIQRELAQYQKWTVRIAVVLALVSLVLGAGQLIIGINQDEFNYRQDELVRLQKEQLELAQLRELSPYVRTLPGERIGLTIMGSEEQTEIHFRDPFFNFSDYYVVTELREVSFFECRDSTRVGVFSAQNLGRSQIFHNLGRRDQTRCEGVSDFQIYDSREGPNAYHDEFNIYTSGGRVAPHSVSFNGRTIGPMPFELLFPAELELTYSAQLDRWHLRHLPLDNCVDLPVIEITVVFTFDAEGNLESGGHPRCQ